MLGFRLILFPSIGTVAGAMLGYGYHEATRGSGLRGFGELKEIYYTMLIGAVIGMIAGGLIGFRSVLKNDKRRKDRDNGSSDGGQ